MLACAVGAVPGRYVGGLDADAAAYIAAIEGDGVSVSAAQRTALNTFYRTGKDEGWYSSLKRFYLPIWAAAAPNARCLVSGTSGTFSGAVDHNSGGGGGWVQGNGSTGYFDLGVSPSTLGLTPASGSLFYLKYDNGAATGFRRNIGVENSANQISTMSQQNGVHAFDYNTTISGRLLTGSIGLLSGVFVGSRQGGDRRYERRYSAGFVSLANASGGDAGTIPTLNLYSLAHNQNGTTSSYSDDKLGAYGAASGFSATESESFSLALKNLWETCTGLSLP